MRTSGPGVTSLTSCCTQPQTPAGTTSKAGTQLTWAPGREHTRPSAVGDTVGTCLGSPSRPGCGRKRVSALTRNEGPFGRWDQ